jgi:hypothetical protein
MATLTISNEFKYERGLGSVDFSSDTFKVILMASGFTFDPDSHGTYADVSASEIADGNGYTAGGETLSASSAWAQDNTDDDATISWSNVTWTASGGAIPDFDAAIIYDDTHASKVIVGCIALDSTVSLASGSSFQLQNLGFSAS